MGTLDARLYWKWFWKGNNFMSGLEGRAGGGGKQRGGGVVGGDGNSLGSGRSLRLLVGAPVPHEHCAMVLGGFSGGGRPFLLCLLRRRAPEVLPALLPIRHP